VIVEAKVKQYNPNLCHDVFIWFPQLLRDCETRKKYWVWLETVKRRRKRSPTKYGYHCYWQYYLNIKETSHG